MSPSSPSSASPGGHHKSKTLATWIALIGGSLGLHRFYLRGLGDPWGWLYPLPTGLGLLGLQRLRDFGQDDLLSWALIPLLGITIVASMFSAILYGLTPDERWHARHNPRAAAPESSGWGAVIGVVLALLIGAGVLMATIAFSGQRYFEYQIEEARKLSP